MQMTLTGHGDRRGLKIGPEQVWEVSPSGRASALQCCLSRLAGSRPSKRPEGWQWTCPAMGEKDNKANWDEKWRSCLRDKIRCEPRGGFAATSHWVILPFGLSAGSSIKLHRHHCWTLCCCHSNCQHTTSNSGHFVLSSLSCTNSKSNQIDWKPLLRIKTQFSHCHCSANPKQCKARQSWALTAHCFVTVHSEVLWCVLWCRSRRGADHDKSTDLAGCLPSTLNWPSLLYQPIISLLTRHHLIIGITNRIYIYISWIVEIFPRVSDLPSPSHTLIITGPFFFPYILVVITGPNKPLCHASFTRGAPPAFANTLHWIFHTGCTGLDKRLLVCFPLCRCPGGGLDGDFSGTVHCNVENIARIANAVPVALFSRTQCNC